MRKRWRTELVDEETGEYIEVIVWREGDTLRSKEPKEFFLNKKYADKTDFVYLLSISALHRDTPLNG